MIAFVVGPCRRQAEEVRRTVLTRPMQERGAAERDGGPLRARSEQHREHAEQHVVADDDIGRELLQRLQQPLVLGRNGVDEDALAGHAEPLQPRRDGLEFGDPREDVVRIEVRALGKGKELDAAGLDAGAKGGAGHESNLMTLGDQDLRDCQHRIEMTRRRRRSDKNLHGR
ncbi:hypothetical protein ABIF52_001912 [Bradyrhizobium japonicum]